MHAQQVLNITIIDLYGDSKKKLVISVSNHMLIKMFTLSDVDKQRNCNNDIS